MIPIAILLVFLLVFSQIYMIVLVSGQSMEPTLRSMQLLIIRRNSMPAKGDIVVFNTNDYGVCVKRVIAGPGSTVEIKDGQLYVDGIQLLSYTCNSDLNAMYTIGDNQYFVIGDNYCASIDSREYGPVPYEDILGVVVLS